MGPDVQMIQSATYSRSLRNTIPVVLWLSTCLFFFSLLNYNTGGCVLLRKNRGWGYWRVGCWRIH